jgi:hypothetical protein
MHIFFWEILIGYISRALQDFEIKTPVFNFVN